MTEQTVIVIGAGMAGISAARHLQDAGIRVTILEARERIGGRIHTNTNFGVALDCGASWIHRVDGNPIYHLTEKYKIKTQFTDYESIKTYDSDGQVVDDDEIEHAENLFEEIMDRLDKEREELDEDISLEAGIQSILAQYKLSPRQQRLMDYLITAEIEHDYAANLSDLSLWYWDQDEEFDGDDVIFPGGYHQLIEKLAEGLDIRLQQVVTEIAYNKRGVTIKTAGGEQFDAAYAIVTLPSGVLKSGRVKFVPPLPAKKQRAIEQSRMGNFNKVYLRFPHIFWDKNEEFISYVSEKHGEWLSWMNYHFYLEEPILLAFNTADYGQKLDNMAEADVIETAMAALKKLYSDGIPDPIDWIITNWGEDPYSMGAYSYLPVGTRGKLYKEMAKPVGKRLLFAGEGTSRKYPATVHGAYLSGKREAERIIKATD